MDRRKKIITLSIFIVVIVLMTIGFAAFSSNLILNSTATVTPNSSDFKVVFSSSSSEVKTDEVAPTITSIKNTVTAESATIDNSTVPTIKNLSATFKSSGDKVEYHFYVHNIGKYVAYLDEVNFNDVSGGSFITCTGEDEDIDEICKGISVKFNIGENALTENKGEPYCSYTNGTFNGCKSTETSSGYYSSLSTGEWKDVKVSLEYNGPAITSNINVKIGNISLFYGTVEGLTESESYEQVFKPDYYWTTFSGAEYRVGDSLPLDKQSSSIPRRHNYYIGIDSDDGENIKTAYMCFVKNGNEYCLKAADSTAYEINKKILIDAFGENVCQSKITSYGDYVCEGEIDSCGDDYGCELDNPFHIEIAVNGYIVAYGDEWCNVSTEFYCGA